MIDFVSLSLVLTFSDLSSSSGTVEAVDPAQEKLTIVFSEINKVRADLSPKTSILDKISQDGLFRAYSSGMLCTSVDIAAQLQKQSENYYMINREGGVVVYEKGCKTATGGLVMVTNETPSESEQPELSVCYRVGSEARRFISHWDDSNNIIHLESGSTSHLVRSFINWQFMQEQGGYFKGKGMWCRGEREDTLKNPPAWH